MLIGRDAECSGIDRLLARARLGKSGVLVVRGDAGIGKTALLRYAAEAARDATVLSARGVESEAVLAYAGLSDVARPLLGRIDELPDAQRAALAGALALGQPGRGDRFATCAATLSLLGAAAETTPLVVLVDDAHWLDPSSGEALAFAARRLEAEGVALVAAVRSGEESAFDGSGFEELTLEPLDREATCALIARTSEGRAAAAVAERLFEETAGNPLAAVELVAALSPAQLAGYEALPETLPAARSVEDAFLARVARLPEATRRVVVIAAASETPELAAIEPAARALGLDVSALEAAEETGLVSVERGNVCFSHPLLRSAVVRATPGSLTRAVHAALASAADGRADGARGWHLAAAAEGSDEEAAATLEDAARDARRRGAHAEAASAFERAGTLSPADESRARHLLEAASDARLAGRPEQALELLAGALGATGDERLRARIQHLRGAVEMWRGAPLAARELLAAEAKRAELSDRGRAARMLTDAAWCAFMVGDVADGIAHAEKACRLAPSGGLTALLARGQLGIGVLLAGRSADAMSLLSQDVLTAGDPRGRFGALVQPGAHVLVWVEEYHAARGLLTEMIDGARSRSALSSLPYALAVLAELDFRTGHWAAAYAGAAEAVELARTTGQAATLAFSLAVAARVEAAHGREDDCRAHVREALRLATYGVGSVVAFAGATLGFLELGLGRTEAAVAQLEAVAAQVRRHGLEEPSVIQWPPDLVEAYVRVGRNDDARAELDSLDQRAAATGRAWTAAAAARCRGLLAPPEVIDEQFGAALALHTQTESPFERARTQLAYGERLRRTRSRSRSREWLRRALETFERLGAEPWAERARTELRASGETARRGDPAASQQLTPQELQVALVVARGATNREAGAALFLSDKTIEAHLGRIYRKLGVRSRTELAAQLAAEGAREAAPA